MSEILKCAPSHPVMFNGIFDDGEIMADFLNSTGLFSISDPNSLLFTKQSLEEGIDLKTPLMDLVITIPPHTLLNVEMQNRKPNAYDINYRLGYYLSKLIGRSLEKGSGYQSKECAVFAVLNFTLYNDERYLRTFLFTDEENHKIPYFKIIVLELTKISFCDKNKLKKWMSFFNTLEPLKLIGDDTMNKETDKAFTKAIRRAIELNASDELAHLLDNYEKIEREIASQFDEGFYEGKAQGLEEGRTLIAKNLKEMGLSISEISQATGLSEEVIEKL